MLLEVNAWFNLCEKFWLNCRLNETLKLKERRKVYLLWKVKSGNNFSCFLCSSWLVSHIDILLFACDFSSIQSLFRSMTIRSAKNLAPQVRPWHTTGRYLPLDLLLSHSSSIFYLLFTLLFSFLSHALSLSLSLSRSSSSSTYFLIFSSFTCSAHLLCLLA